MHTSSFVLIAADSFVHKFSSEFGTKKQVAEISASQNNKYVMHFQLIMCVRSSVPALDSLWSLSADYVCDFGWICCPTFPICSHYTVFGPHTPTHLHPVISRIFTVTMCRPSAFFKAFTSNYRNGKGWELSIFNPFIASDIKVSY